ncbi:MAG: bifunctional phosphoglucose/phosphomannose isomerase, partial [Phaeodactylibacter sp.]|nr:bifunctional phosphoglucose/phosphomannose isomerase [Phaeodactylibacter sp.]
MMDKLVAEFPAQLKEAMEIGRNAQINPHHQPIYRAHAAGLGGSGIGANFVAAFIRDESTIPYTVSKGYSVPKFVDKHTLALASSYSGNTEETLSSFEQYLDTGAKIVVIASGGKLIEAAQTHGLDYIQLPGGKPSPRACLGYSLVQQLYVFSKLGFIGAQYVQELEKASALLEQEQEQIMGKARQIAGYLQGKIPIIYTTDRMEPVAIRFRQQLNENSKMLCWHHVVPEMNHNELVGWRAQHPEAAVVFLRNSDDHYRNSLRIDINKEIIGNYTQSLIEVYSRGESLIERSLYFVHLVDWVSVFLADLQ